MKNIFFTLLIMMTALSVNAQEQFRTQTIGGWGSNPSGNNPGAYLASNFDAVFGAEGVTIGMDANTITFTSASAIQKFLPSSGKSEALAMSYLDPKKQEVRNTFASQTLALTISLAMDKSIESYSVSTKYLGDMVVAEGEMEGVKVSTVLQEANKALAGVESAYSIATLNETISKINENYVDGEITGTFVKASAGTTHTTTETSNELDAVKF